MSDEIWKDVIGFEGLYQVSNRGQVKRLERRIFIKRPKQGDFWNTLKEMILVQRLDRYGYKRITLWKDGNMTTYTTHQLVAYAFIGEKPTGYHVNHIDGNKLNNTPDNLEYVTSGENTRHAIAMGLVCNKGVNNPSAKLTAGKVKTLRALHDTGKYIQAKIARIFDISKSHMSAICNRRVWKHVD